MIKRVIVIAEAGVNHNGDMEMAQALIDVAATAGADYVKFQTFTADCLVTKNAEKVDYQKKYSLDQQETQYKMLKKLELSASDHRILHQYAQKKNIGFLSTGFDIKSVNFLLNFGIDYVKIPSGEITNLPYLRHIGGLNMPTLLSTGMSTLDEVGGAISILINAGLSKDKITLLHCTSAYPAPYSDVNLIAMQTMRKKFGLAVGYSDHTLGAEVSIAAVALGAQVIEKHFTLDVKLPGPDHSISMEPDALRCMVLSIRNIEASMGSKDKRPANSEIQNRILSRRSIVASRCIEVGEVFNYDSVTFKRPGMGISPMNIDNLIGKTARKKYQPDDLIDDE